MKLLFLSLVSIVLSMSAFGTTYYVDFQGGSDNNPGTSSVSAWKHCPGDPSATGLASSTSPNPGDIVAFKAGVVYKDGYQINIVSSGVQGSPITYEGSLSGFGTGKAIFDSASSNPVMYLNGKSFVTIDGIEFRNWTGSAVWQNPNGVFQGVVISNCNIHDGISVDKAALYLCGINNLLVDWWTDV